MVYEGTYGIFSVALVITIAYSYAMEKNESLENVVMYVVVALAAFSAQLNLGTEDFDVAGLDVLRQCLSVICPAWHFQSCADAIN